MSICVDRFISTGQVNVDYPMDLRTAVENAVESWKKFCALPKEEKQVFEFFEDSHGDGAGYELKEEKGSKKDLKENFHVTLFQHDRLQSISNAKTFAFLNDAATLFNAVEPLIVQFCQAIEEKYKVNGLVEEVQTSKPYWVLRYLHYFGNQETNTEIAIPHVDKGGFTLHLYESDTGLQFYCQSDFKWKEMPVNHHQTVIISAIQLQFMSKGQLKALCHRVVANEKTSRTGRFSVVCFVPFEHIPQYNKNLYGSMQNHEPAFNYQISFEELKKYFKPDHELKKE